MDELTVTSKRDSILILKKTLSLSPFILLFLLLASIPSLNASTIQFNAKTDEIQFHCTLYFQQNFTKLNPQHLQSDPQIEDFLRELFISSIQHHKSDATLNNISLIAEVEEDSILLTITFTMHVQGEQEFKYAATDLSWKAFNISHNIAINNFELNRVGETYLTPVVGNYSDPAYSRIMNGTRFVEPENALTILETFTLLDFRATSVPLDQWTRTFFVDNSTTTWKLNPEPRLNMTLAYATENVTRLYQSTFVYTALVSVPFMGFAEGDIIYHQTVESHEEVYMIVIIISLLVITIILAIVSRKMRVKKQPILKKKK